MFHPIFQRILRDRMAAMLVRERGLTLADAMDRVNAVSAADLAAAIEKARDQTGIALPDAAMTAMHFPDGHRIEELKTWFADHPGVEEFLKIAISIAIAFI